MTLKSIYNHRNLLIFYYIVFFGLFAYQALGFFPIAPVESDGIGVANGVVEMAQKGLGKSKVAYNYWVQPGAYVIVLCVYKITNADAFAIYSVLSAIACIGFVLIGAMLLGRLTSYPLPLCGLMLLLFQETLAGGYYANSTVLAAPFAFLSLHIAANYRKLGPLFIAGVLMATAGWIRIDVLLVAPACLVLLYDQDIKQAILKTMFVAFVTVIFAGVLLNISGSGFDKIFADTESIKGIQNYSLVAVDEKAGLEINHYIKTLIVFFPLLIVLMSFTGLIYGVAQRQWKIIALCVMGVAPTVIAHFTTFDTPKRLYICLPLLALPPLLCFNYFKQCTQGSRRVWGGLCTLLLVGQYLSGMTVDFANKPWSSRPYPQIATFFTWNPPLEQANQVSLVLGSGDVITTGDYLRLSSGLYWSPLFWSNEKKQFNNNLNILKIYLKQTYPSSVQVLATTHEMKQIVNLLLINDGYALVKYLKGQYSLLLWEKKNHSVALYYYEYYGEDYEYLEKAINTMNIRKFIWLSECSWQHPLLLQKASENNKINQYGYEIKM